MDSFISLPGSAAVSATTSPMSGIPGKSTLSTPTGDALVKLEKDDTTTTTSETRESTQQQKSEAAIENLKQLDPLAMVLELVEVVQSGQIAPKDVYNAAGPIRLKLSKAKTSLQDIEGLDQTIEKRRDIIAELKHKIVRQTELLQKFQERMGVNTTTGEVAHNAASTIVKSELDSEVTMDIDPK